MTTFGQKEDGRDLRHTEASTAIQGGSLRERLKNVSWLKLQFLRNGLLFQYQILSRK